MLVRFLKELIWRISGVRHLREEIKSLRIHKGDIEKLRELEQELAKLKARIDNKEIPTSLAAPQLSNNNKAIFICGLHRSGTSIFAKILQSHKLIHGFEKTGAIQDEGQFLQSVYTPDGELGGPGSFGFDRRSHLTENAKNTNEACRKQLIKEWGLRLPGTGEYFLEKSPANLVKTRFLQKLFPNSIFIVIKRHPLAVAMATQKWSYNSPSLLVKHWIKCYQTWNADKKHVNNYLEYYYEDFVTRPHEIFEEILKKLQLEPCENLKAAIDKARLSATPNEKYLSQIVKLTSEYKKISRSYEKDIEKLGYDLKGNIIDQH